MKIRSQVGMVLNLDKCIGCHTCSITCKNVWTSREGVEYAWFNNVETKPGVGFPNEWENQDKWNGGWVRKDSGKIEPRIGGKLKVLAKIFNNPDMPDMGIAVLAAAIDMGAFEYQPADVVEPDDCPADVTGDGEVGFQDLIELLALWGACP